MGKTKTAPSEPGSPTSGESSPSSKFAKKAAMLKAKTEAKEKAEMKKLLMEADATATIQAKHIRKFPLFLAVFFIILFPMGVFLERATTAMNKCEQRDLECTNKCQVEWEALLSTLQGNAKFMREQAGTELRECNELCGSGYAQCALETGLFMLAAGLIGGSFFCVVWLFTMTMELLIRQEEKLQSENAAKLDEERKRKTMVRKTMMCKDQKKFSRKLQNTGIDIDALFSEKKKTEPVKCVKCAHEIDGQFVEKVPSITKSVAWKVAPLYCPKCEAVQYGFV